jgi:hypothetical protein
LRGVAPKHGLARALSEALIPCQAP